MTISIVQMDLVCEKNGYIEASQSMFMAGCLIGCLLFGGISDRYTPKTLVDGVKVFQNWKRLHDVDYMSEPAITT